MVEIYGKRNNTEYLLTDWYIFFWYDCFSCTQWLQYLASRYNGSFHAPDLSLESDVRKSDGGNKSAILPVGDDGDSLQIITVKSQTTILRERFNDAEASGRVISLVGTTTMKDTFQTISSAITSLRTGSKSVKVEREIVLEEDENQSSLQVFNATRMVLDSTSGKISVANGEKSNSRRIKIAQQPFAQGGLRNVYRMYEMHDGAEISLVGKESRHKVHYNERLKFHIETSTCQLQASEYARRFNEKVVATPSVLNLVKPVQVLTAEVYRLNDPQAPGKFRYLAVEKRIDGQYEKWNGNNGYIHGDTTSYPFKVAQAFRYVVFLVRLLLFSCRKASVFDISHRWSIDCNFLKKMCFHFQPFFVRRQWSDGNGRRYSRFWRPLHRSSTPFFEEEIRTSRLWIFGIQQFFQNP